MPFGSSQWMYSSGFYPTKIDQSLRFDGTAYLTRTPSVAGDLKTWTFSGWVKRGNFDTEQPIFAARPNSTYPFSSISFTTANAIKLRVANGGSINVNLVTNALFRDPSAWYHVCAVWDTTEAVTADRYLVYVNGVLQVTSGTLTLPINSDSPINDDNRNFIGVQGTSGGGIDTDYFDGYLADTYFVDGTALDPTSFGEFKSGVWIPKAYTGSYGTNGFHLEYNDNANDSSGTGNNWTATNIVAGDYMLDSPTNNYATWNPLRPSAAMTYSDGNLSATSSGGSGRSSYGTLGMSSGKWYFELTGGDNSVGVATNESDIYAIYLASGSYNINGTTISGKATYTTTDIIGIAYNADGSVIEFFKNGASQGSTSFTAGFNLPIVAQFNGTFSATRTCIANFGQSGFTYTPPAGFLALSTANLPEPSISPLYGASPQDHFNTVLWSGNSSTQSITGVGFQPDWVWGKSRNFASNHGLYDSVRGATLQLASADTSDEATVLDGLTSFDTDGFSLGDGSRLNNSGRTYVAWNWKASNAASVLNEEGTIPSQVSANTTAGFSIVSYTGNTPVANATVGHGLDSVLDMIIVKNRDRASGWLIYHSANTSAPETDFLQFTAAGTTDNNTVWNDTAPTTSVFSIGTTSSVNFSGENFIAYCFHSVEGYSKFSGYTGNNDLDGPFIYTGFRPAWVLIKRYNTIQDWVIYDAIRDSINAVGKTLEPNEPNSEGARGQMDFVSNGFKLRGTNSVSNGSGTYIYMAFAENPFKYANAR
jgi:hypothetical protein